MVVNELVKSSLDQSLNIRGPSATIHLAYPGVRFPLDQGYTLAHNNPQFEVFLCYLVAIQLADKDAYIKGTTLACIAAPIFIHTNYCFNAPTFFTP